MLAEMPQEGDLSQRPAREDDLVKDARDALDGDASAGERVLYGDHKAVCPLPEGSEQGEPVGHIEKAVEGGDGVVASESRQSEPLHKINRQGSDLSARDLSLKGCSSGRTLSANGLGSTPACSRLAAAAILPSPVCGMPITVVAPAPAPPAPPDGPAVAPVPVSVEGSTPSTGLTAPSLEGGCPFPPSTSLAMDADVPGPGTPGVDPASRVRFLLNSAGLPESDALPGDEGTGPPCPWVEDEVGAVVGRAPGAPAEELEPEAWE